MTMHKSLKVPGAMKRQRNVLSRAERIAILEDEGRWVEEENSVFGLPKVRQYVMKRRSSAVKAEETGEDGEAAEATETEE